MPQGHWPPPPADWLCKKGFVGEGEPGDRPGGGAFNMTWQSLDVIAMLNRFAGIQLGAAVTIRVSGAAAWSLRSQHPTPEARS